MTTEPVAILHKLKATFPSPESWTQGVFGRTADGEVCNYRAPECVSRCLIGGLASVVPPKSEVGNEFKYLFEAAKELGFIPSYGFTARVALSDANDYAFRSFENLHRVIDRAIELAEGAKVNE